MGSSSREHTFLVQQGRCLHARADLDDDDDDDDTYSGAGPIGLVSLLAAKALGATPIIITDLFQSRLDFAKTLHPDVRTVLVERGRTAEEVALQIREAAGGEDLKFALECTGVESSIRTCIFVSDAYSISSRAKRWLIHCMASWQSMAFGGKVFVIGVGKAEQNVSATFTTRPFTRNRPN